MTTPTGNIAFDATTLVFDGWTKYQALGDSWILQASNAIAELDTIQIEPISFDVEFDVDAFAPTFVRPVRPVAPDLDAVDTPDVPELDEVTTRDIGDAPVAPDLSGYTEFQPPSPPTQPIPTAPSDLQPVLVDITVPERPDYALPAVPTLFELSLPEVPVITLPEFDGVRPTFDIDMPDDLPFVFNETPYSSTLLDEMKSVISNMMQGNYGLPPSVEQAIFDRGRAREDRLSRKQVMEVSEDMASRGLSEPTGILAARLREVRFDNREKTGELNQALTIERAKEVLEGVKFAVAQGMALEQTLIQMTMSVNERSLKAAMFAREYVITRINALISYANLQQQAYATDAQVWRTRIEGELSKLEQMKAEIDAQRLVGEINRDLIAQYEAQVRGVLGLADLYKSDVEAARVKGEINVQRIDMAKLLLQRFSTEVDAWGKLQDGYKHQVDAALGRVKFGEALANVFATQMQGYKTKGEAFFNESRFKLEKNGQTLDLFRSQLQRADFSLRSLLGLFQAQAGMYEADGTIAQAESASLDRAAGLKIEVEKNRTAVAVQAAQMRLDQMLKIAEILVEQIKTKAMALSQLAAASQAGVSLGASINGSGSTSKSASIGWSGETADYTGLPPSMAF